MKLKIKYLIILFLLICMKSYSHDLHISIVNISLINDSNIAKICIKAELDDFNEICTDKSQSCRTKYLSNKILFFFNDKNVNSQMQLVKTEYDNYSLWYYYEIKYEKEISKIKLENYFLLEKFDNQKNLLIINSGETESGYELNSAKRSIEILIDK